MFKGKIIFIKQGKTIGIGDWIVRSKYTSEGFKLPCLDQSPVKRYFNRTRIVEYPPVEELPLPSNIKASSERLKFSPQRSRDINGSYIKFFSFDVKFKEANPEIQDERVQCYDCSGTINLSSVMQTNVPFPFKSKGKPTHLNMPGGQWAQNEKYTAEDLNNLHHSNSKLSTRNGGTCSLGVKSAARNSFLCFSEMDLRICDCLHSSFNIFSYQLRNFSSHKGNMENFDKLCEKKMETNDTSQISKKEKLKATIRDYGSVILVFHIGISLISLGCCYGLVSSGVDLGAILKDWGVKEGAVAAGTAAQFIVAYAVHKTFAPARIALTLSAAPFAVKKLRKIGLLKPVGVKV